MISKYDNLTLYYEMEVITIYICTSNVFFCIYYVILFVFLEIYANLYESKSEKILTRVHLRVYTLSNSKTLIIISK